MAHVKCSALVLIDMLKGNPHTYLFAFSLHYMYLSCAAHLHVSTEQHGFLDIFSSVTDDPLGPKDSDNFMCHATCHSLLRHQTCIHLTASFHIIQTLIKSAMCVISYWILNYPPTSHPPHTHTLFWAW